MPAPSDTSCIYREIYQLKPMYAELATKQRCFFKRMNFCSHMRTKEMYLQPTVINGEHFHHTLDNLLCCHTLAKDHFAPHKMLLYTYFTMSNSVRG